jgi:plastocyanin
MVEFKNEVPAKLTLVDHALFRIHRGAVGMIAVKGPSNPDVFSSIQNATQGPQVDQHMVNMTATTSTAATGTQAASTSNAVQVMIMNYAYTPSDLTITAGTTVTWVNMDPVGHTVTEGLSDSPKPPSERAFDSSHGTAGADVITIPPGGSWSFTFTTPGVYDYYCIPHPYMKGHITVTPFIGGGTQSYGYGDLSNFYLVVTGRELIGLSALGLVVVLGAMLILSRQGRKQELTPP